MKLYTDCEQDILFVGEINGIRVILVCACVNNVRAYYRLTGNFTRTSVMSNNSVSKNTFLTTCDWLIIEKADTFLDIDTEYYGTRISITDSPFTTRALDSRKIRGK